MCVVDQVHNPTCNHTTSHLLMACNQQPKIRHANSEFKYCANPTYRSVFTSEGYTCIICRNMGVQGKENVPPNNGREAVSGSKAQK